MAVGRTGLPECLRESHQGSATVIPAATGVHGPFQEVGRVTRLCPGSDWLSQNCDWIRLESGAASAASDIASCAFCQLVFGRLARVPLAGLPGTVACKSIEWVCRWLPQSLLSHGVRGIKAALTTSNPLLDGVKH